MHKSYSFQGWWLACEPSPHAHQAKLSYIHILLYSTWTSLQCVIICYTLTDSAQNKHNVPNTTNFQTAVKSLIAYIHYIPSYFCNAQTWRQQSTCSPTTTAAPSSVTPSLISVIQFLVVSLCFHKTLVCCARIFHVSTITAGRPLPGPIFSLLELFSTSAAGLKFSSISLTLRSSWRICRASWTIYKYQSFSSYLCRTILCDF